MWICVDVSGGVLCQQWLGGKRPCSAHGQDAHGDLRNHLSQVHNRRINTWNDSWCSVKCRKAHYVKLFMSVFWLDQMTLCAMTLRKLPPFLRPNVISNSPSDRLSIHPSWRNHTWALLYIYKLRNPSVMLWAVKYYKLSEESNFGSCVRYFRWIDGNMAEYGCWFCVSGTHFNYNILTILTSN